MKSVVLSEKFNALVKQSDRLQPRACKCGYAPQIKVHYAFYGPTGVKIECERCKRKSGIHGISEVIRCGEMIGTPVTYRSLIKGIKKAVREWNLL